MMAYFFFFFFFFFFMRLCSKSTSCDRIPQVVSQLCLIAAAIVIAIRGQKNC